MHFSHDFKLLNIGCGDVYHEDWINVDLIANLPYVLKCNLKNGLPFNDEYFDACYSAHVLEHLNEEEGIFFIREQSRVLKPGGIIRVVVPDLERICRNYICFLEKLKKGDQSVEYRYDFTMFELFDQFSREKSGGNYKRFIPPKKMDDQVFVQQRWGKNVLINKSEKHSEYTKMHSKISFIYNVNRFLRKLLRINRKIAELCVRILVGSDAIEALKLGLFRMSGEVHKTMYDSYSISRLLSSNELVDSTLCSADESLIPDFNSYKLDVIDGYCRKPDSLYIEAQKRK